MDYIVRGHKFAKSLEIDKIKQHWITLFEEN
jgi:hypothetical protein